MPPAPPPPCPFTEPELRWVFARLARCRFPVGSFPKRFARRNDFENLTREKGWPMAAHLAYQYRRQIFKNSARWDREHFNRAVKAKVASLDRATFRERLHALLFPPAVPRLTWPAPCEPQLTFSFAC